MDLHQKAGAVASRPPAHETELIETLPDGNGNFDENPPPPTGSFDSESNDRISELGHDPIREVCIFELKPSPENDELYKPVNETDPDIVELARSIAQRGVMEPLVITMDFFILSGHRRFVGAKLAGLDSVPCRVKSFNRIDDPDQFVILLREYNRQREKSFDEKLREEVISIDPAAA